MDHRFRFLSSDYVALAVAFSVVCVFLFRLELWPLSVMVGGVFLFWFKQLFDNREDYTYLLSFLCCLILAGCAASFPESQVYHQVLLVGALPRLNLALHGFISRLLASISR